MTQVMPAHNIVQGFDSVMKFFSSLISILIIQRITCDNQQLGGFTVSAPHK